MTSEMKVFILDLHNAMADFDNGRLTGEDLRDEIAEIIADRDEMEGIIANRLGFLK